MNTFGQGQRCDPQAAGVDPGRGRRRAVNDDLNLGSRLAPARQRPTFRPGGQQQRAAGRIDLRLFRQRHAGRPGIELERLGLLRNVTRAIDNLHRHIAIADGVGRHGDRPVAGRVGRARAHDRPIIADLDRLAGGGCAGE